jgi:hypothetical protein
MYSSELNFAALEAGEKKLIPELHILWYSQLWHRVSVPETHHQGRIRHKYVRPNRLCRPTSLHEVKTQRRQYAQTRLPQIKQLR